MINFTDKQQKIFNKSCIAFCKMLETENKKKILDCDTVANEGHYYNKKWFNDKLDKTNKKREGSK